MEVAPIEAVRFTLQTQEGRFYRFRYLPLSEETSTQLQLLDALTLEPQGDAQTTIQSPIYYRPIYRQEFMWRATATPHSVLELRSREKTASVFQYSFEEVDDDSADTIPDATPLSFPAEFTGYLNSRTDVDTWRVSVPPGHIVFVQCFFTHSINNPYATLGLLLPGGQEVGEPFTGINGSVNAHLYKHVQGGELIVRVSSEEFFNSPEYKCVVQDRGLDDHPDAYPEATRVGVPSTTSVRVQTPSDRDVLAADLLEGHTYQFSSRASPFYLVTWVLDAQGQVAREPVSADQYGFRFTAPRSERYFFSLYRGRGDGLWKWEPPTGFSFTLTDQTPAP